VSVYNKIAERLGRGDQPFFLLLIQHPLKAKSKSKDSLGAENNSNFNANTGVEAGGGVGVGAGVGVGSKMVEGVKYGSAASSSSSSNCDLVSSSGDFGYHLCVYLNWISPDHPLISLHAISNQAFILLDVASKYDEFCDQKFHDNVMQLNETRRKNSEEIFFFNSQQIVPPVAQNLSVLQLREGTGSSVL